MIRKTSKQLHPCDREYIEQQEEKIMQLRERLAKCEDTSERNILRLRLKTCGENIMRLLCHSEHIGFNNIAYICGKDSYSDRIEKETGARRIDVIDPLDLDRAAKESKEAQKAANI